MIKYYLSTIFLVNFCLLNAQQTDSAFIKQLSTEILNNGQAYNNLYELTKNIGGRLSGSSQNYLAETWGYNQLQKAGALKVFFQDCLVPHWIRGDKETVYITYENVENKKIEKYTLDALALGNSIGTNQKLVSAPLILIHSFEELEQSKNNIKGKIVFYDYKFNQSFINPFEAYADAVRYRSQGASKASKYGAIATIIRSISGSTDNNPHTGALRYDTNFLAIPAYAIGLKDADFLENMLNKQNIILNIKSNSHFLPDTLAHNVVGEIKGSEFSDEIITIGGHLDSWDAAEGAQDDGAGVVQTIEVLRALKSMGYLPKHTIRFVLFANEENGLRGGLKYAQLAKENNEKHLFALETDAGGFSPRGFSITAQTSELEKIRNWIPLLKNYGITDIYSGGGGADVSPLNHIFKTAVGELQPDAQRYFDYHHARNDVFENVNKRELLLGTVALAALIYLIDQHGL